MKKVCSRCKHEKDISQFNKGQNKCKECSRELGREHYKRNKDQYVRKQREKRRRRVDLIQEYKASKGCQQCGESHIACLDFHHINGNEKETSTLRAIWSGWPWERIMKEVDKCTVLCSNCHRKIHYQENRK